MSTLHMCLTCRGMNKAAASQCDVSRIRDSDTLGSKSERRERSGAAASALQAGAIDRVPKP